MPRKSHVVTAVSFFLLGAIVSVAATLLPLVAAVALVFAVGIARVQNESMSPTLAAGDAILFDRVLAPVRGDVVVFRDAAEWSGRPGVLLVKRVIGVGGDRVVCCEVATGRLLVNGEPVIEPYEPGERPGGRVPFSVSVPPGAVWVMGDNRDASRDSRAALTAPGHGAVPVDQVLGVARLSWPGDAAARTARSRAGRSAGIGMPRRRAS